MLEAPLDALSIERGLDGFSGAQADAGFDAFMEAEARAAIWHDWIERARDHGAHFDHDRIAFWTTDSEGDSVPVPILPPDAEMAAAEELLRDGEPDVEGDEDGPVF